MDLMIFGFFAAIFIVFAVLSKRIAFIGIVAGIGLILLSLTIQTDSIQIQNGFNETVTGNTTVRVPVYSNVQTVFPGLSVYFLTALTLILGGAGILIVVHEVGG